MNYSKACDLDCIVNMYKQELIYKTVFLSVPPPPTLYLLFQELHLTFPLRSIQREENSSHLQFHVY